MKEIQQKIQMDLKGKGIKIVEQQINGRKEKKGNENKMNRNKRIEQKKQSRTICFKGLKFKLEYS